MGFEQWSMKAQVDDVHDSEANASVNQPPLNGDTPGNIIYQTVGPGRVAAYRYLRCSQDAAAMASGDAACFSTEQVNGHDFHVATQIGETTERTSSPYCGSAVSAQTVGQFGYYQFLGQNQVALLTDGSVAAGEMLEAITAGVHDTHVFTATTVATDYLRIAGYTEAADTASLMPVNSAVLLGLMFM